MRGGGIIAAALSLLLFVAECHSASLGNSGNGGNSSSSSYQVLPTDPGPSDSLTHFNGAATAAQDIIDVGASLTTDTDQLQAIIGDTADGIADEIARAQEVNSIGLHFCPKTYPKIARDVKLKSYELFEGLVS